MDCVPINMLIKWVIEPVTMSLLWRFEDLTCHILNTVPLWTVHLPAM